MLAKIGFCFNYLHISLHNYHVIGSEFQISLHKYIFGIFVLKYDCVRLYDTMHAGFSLIFLFIYVFGGDVPSLQKEYHYYFILFFVRRIL